MNGNLSHFSPPERKSFEVTVSCLTTTKTECDCFKWMHNMVTSYPRSGLITTRQDIKLKILSVAAAFHFLHPPIFIVFLLFAHTHTHIKHTQTLAFKH